MRKILFTALFVFFWTSAALAQDDFNKFELSGSFSTLRAKTAALSHVDGLGNRDLEEGESRQFNGFEASATYNFTRYFGAKFDVSGHFASYDIPILPGTNLVRTSGTGVFIIVVPTANTHTEHRLYNFLGGVQIKDNAKKGRFKPFAHALVGAARQSVKYDLVQTIFASTFTNPAKQTSWAAALGGGLDIRVGRRVDVRVIQLDYNPVFRREQTLLSPNAQITNPLGNTGMYVPDITSFYQKQTQHNFRVGFGIVFH